jgi:hypothetical protein
MWRDILLKDSKEFPLPLDKENNLGKSVFLMIAWLAYVYMLFSFLHCRKLDIGGSIRQFSRGIGV